MTDRELLGLLRSLEWSFPTQVRRYIGPLEDWQACPTCKHSKPIPNPQPFTVQPYDAGHGAGCQLAAAIEHLESVRSRSEET